MRSDPRVTVITGTGGMGLAIARRLGPGSTIVIADHDSNRLDPVAESLRQVGHVVVPHAVDISDAESVRTLAKTAADLGQVTAVVHTAGLSPSQADIETILKVNLLGAALVSDAFGEVIAPGGAGVFIASMAGHRIPVAPELETLLRSTPTADLLAIPALADLPAPVVAYGVSKRGNQLRVRDASITWGRRGARVNSISPGVIITPMALLELESKGGDSMRERMELSGTGRFGTPEDIAAAVAFLVGPESGFITGTDLAVDGGVFATL
jgi:NAD(P)-dependent dehydrogenase (short-subunit alcohol dehydrogenase family)